jgi:hypothetical protein
MPWCCVWNLWFSGTERDNCDGKENAKFRNEVLHCTKDGKIAENDLDN